MGLKDLSGRLPCWSLLLHAYNFNIEHRKGSEKIVADMLSRAQMVQEITKKWLFDFETLEFESEEYLGLIKLIMENQDKLPDIKYKMECF